MSFRRYTNCQLFWSTVAKTLYGKYFGQLTYAVNSFGDRPRSCRDIEISKQKKSPKHTVWSVVKMTKFEKKPIFFMFGFGGLC
jgi:hypothetical protein